MEVKGFDFEFGGNDSKDNTVKVETQQDDYGFKGISNYSYRVVFHAINSYFKLEDLLKGLGINVMRMNMYCPFHEDKLTGKPSAKFHFDTDTLYCFSEKKSFTAYHALKMLYGANMEKKFFEAWGSLSEDKKEEILLNYQDENVNEKSEYIHPIWKQLEVVTQQFKLKNIDFHKHKNGLYKVLSMMADYDKENR